MSLECESDPLSASVAAKVTARNCAREVSLPLQSCRRNPPDSALLFVYFFVVPLATRSRPLSSPLSGPMNERARANSLRFK